MTLPGWVGVGEPRGRLGGLYAKNVTICPTQACTTPLGDKLAYSSSGAFGYMLGFFAVDFATHDLRITFGEGSFFMCFGIRGFEALSFCAFS